MPAHRPRGARRRPRRALWPQPGQAPGREADSRSEQSLSAAAVVPSFGKHRVPVMSPAKALLLDTFSLFFRAFFALPPMSTTRGEPTGALYGFSALLLKLLREHPGAELCFALDTGRPTFRPREFEPYKAQRAPASTP